MPDHKRHIKYFCICCDYTTQKKSNYMKHCNSKKHFRNIIVKKKEEIINEREDEKTIIDLKTELYDLKKDNKYLEEDNKRLEKENKRLYKEMMKYRKELNYRKAGLK